MNRKQYLEALDRLEGQIEKVYLDAIREVVSRASVRELEAAIKAQNVEEILAAAGISEASLSMTTEAIRGAFIAGGVAEAGTLRTVFNIRNPRAEAWLADSSSKLVTMIMDSQREAIREVLTFNMELGRGPRQTALDIVGRVNRITGRREGGIIGLTGPQGAYVASARKELMELDRHYFTRSRRDRRFDPTVMRAIKEGQPLSSADIDRIVGRYSDRLLQTRGEAIGRTEAIEALNAGAHQSLQQALDSGEIPPQFVKRVWEAANDSRTRDAHAQMHGQEQPAGAPFRSPSGSLMMFPGDSSLGAAAADIINCRCHLKVQVDHMAIAAAKARALSA